MNFLPLVVVLFIAPFGASALPHSDGIVTVGDREFFVGELTQSFGDDARSFKFRHAPWLEILLDNDPVLSDQDVRFLRSGIPATDLIGDVTTQRRPDGKLEDDPMYMADGHDVLNYGDLVHYVYPMDSTIKYSVYCTRGLEPGLLNICRLRVAYPYATNVVLTANQYFPGQLAEISGNFERIASRMVEIATCLDVTDHSDVDRPVSEAELLTQSPDLSDCQILLSS